MNATKPKLYKTARAAAKAWGAPLGIRGKQGSTYLYHDDEGQLLRYRPWFNAGRTVQGWMQLGFMLEKQGILTAHFDPKTREFQGYEVTP